MIDGFFTSLYTLLNNTKYRNASVWRSCQTQMRFFATYLTYYAQGAARASVHSLNSRNAPYSERILLAVCASLLLPCQCISVFTRHIRCPVVALSKHLFNHDAMYFLRLYEPLSYSQRSWRSACEKEKTGERLERPMLF